MLQYITCSIKCQSSFYFVSCLFFFKSVIFVWFHHHPKWISKSPTHKIWHWQNVTVLSIIIFLCLWIYILKTCNLDLTYSFWLISPDLCYIVIHVGATAGCGLAGTTNLGDYGADDPWRSQELPALPAQRSNQLFLAYRNTLQPYIRCSLLHSCDGVNCHTQICQCANT